MLYEVITIRIFESVAGHVLDQLGYDRVHVNDGEEQVFSEGELETFHAENERLKQHFLNGVEKGDLERRDRQASLLAEIETRECRGSMSVRQQENAPTRNNFV